MAAKRAGGGLECDEDLTFQRRAWKVQRCAWGVMAAVVVLGALGLFGEGPLSWATAASSDGELRLEYERFERREKQSELTFSVQARPGVARLWLGESYLNKVEIERIEPPPSGREVEADGISYLFAVRGPEGTGRITFSIRPRSAGVARGEVRLNDRSAVSFRQLIYP